MAVTSDLIVFGDLTGSGTQDTVHTATGTEYVTATFFNHDSVSRTLSIWVNAVANANLLLSAATLATKESVVLELKMASGDLIKAEASAATAINCIIETDLLV